MKDGLYFARHPAHNPNPSFDYPLIVLISNHRPVYTIQNDFVRECYASERIEHYEFGPEVVTGEAYRKLYAEPKRNAVPAELGSMA